NTFSVVLTAQPTNDVVVTTTRSGGAAVLSVATGAALTFNSGNWNVAQTVRIQSGHDANAVDDVATFTVASSGLPSHVVTATQADRDVLGVVVSATSLNVAEGGSNTFTVVLSAQPTNSVVVTTTGGSGVLTLGSGGTLTFTPGNWNVPQ